MKCLKFNYLLIGLVTLLLAMALWPAIPWHSGSQDTLAQIKSRGVLRVSTINSSLTWQKINNNPTGMDYELAKRFADYLGVKLEVTVRPNIESLFDDLNHHRADLLTAGLTWDSARQAQYRSGPAYYSTTQQLVYRVDKPRPKNLGDLHGTLAVPSESSFVPTLEAAKQGKFPQLSWEIEKKLSPQEMLERVADGKLDYTLGDSVTIGMMQRIHPRLAVAFDVTNEVPVNWYMAKSSDDSLNAALLDFYNSINEEGTLARLDEKYLGHTGSFDYVDTRTFLRAIDSTLPSLQPLFKKYASQIDWRLLAAIAYQESHWDPQATSPTGVRGMMMLTRNTADSLEVSDRLDAAESIRGGSQYLQKLMEKMPETIPPDERIWFALTAYNIGYAHMMDARKLTMKQGGNPDSWTDVKTRLPLLEQKRYYSQTTYGYARGGEAYNYVENIRKYNISLVGYLQEVQKRRQPDTVPATTSEPQIAMN
ncbi:membrane-bound lytic murein transglycosylase MltF [Tatumella sp. UBA2305]|uniref:membrane-bound lytic murein transglycosylase MltF n=1 Tax=Tatumella sp. UBA2305 TaxID=1947647 RepID=UPI0025E47E45|nr:membrane-bound lytic murein transglycosylase MltF [Tatumella sp. UBA2305]